MSKKKQTKSGATIRRVLGLIRPYRGQVVLTLFLAALTVFTTLLAPVLTGKAVDFIIGPGQVDFAGLLKHPAFQFQQCQRRSHIGGVFRNGFDQRVCVERRAGQQGAEPVLERAGRVGGSRQRFRSRCFGGFPGRLRVRRAVLIAVI